ncbi:MAG: hypothetical protein IT338_12820 [Thermomicrobiales bacterium]|nr:hypothetical protein [Thermomicrobiales bacterium]
MDDDATLQDETESRAPVRRRPGARRYVATLPERLARAAVALVGGAVYETSLVALPRAVRDAKLYQVTIDRLLRIMIEWVGDVRDIYEDEETSVEELAARKFAGNLVEWASIFAVGWSPLWLLAAASDVMGGSKVYLRTLVQELQDAGRLPAEASVASYEELLGRLEAGSGVLADAIDIPPMSVAEARASFAALRRQASGLPPPEELAALFKELQATARREDRSLLDVSTALALAAARAGVDVGNAYIFDFYRDALGAIRDEGLLRFLRRVATPYVSRAGRHFDPSAATYTDRLAGWLDRRRERATQHSNPDVGRWRKSS